MKELKAKEKGTGGKSDKQKAFSKVAKAKKQVKEREDAKKKVAKAAKKKCKAEKKKKRQLYRKEKKKCEDKKMKSAGCPVETPPTPGSPMVEVF